MGAGEAVDVNLGFLSPVVCLKPGREDGTEVEGRYGLKP